MNKLLILLMMISFGAKAMNEDQKLEQVKKIIQNPNNDWVTRMLALYDKDNPAACKEQSKMIVEREEQNRRQREKSWGLENPKENN